MFIYSHSQKQIMVLKHVAPLRSSFLLIAMVGFAFSTLYVAKYDLTWGITFALIFFAIFIAAFIAMERASPDEQLMLIPVIEKPRPRPRAVKKAPKKKTRRKKRK